MEVVKVDDTIRWHAVSFGAQVEFGYQPAASARERGYNHGPDSRSDGITREH